jgi:hypothetical protein
MKQPEDPFETIERLLPLAKRAALARGGRDPLWDMIHRAEALLLQNERGDPALAATIADWMSVRFSGGRL